MDDREAALGAFREAAVAWAAGGRGQPIVNAAADALAAGVDSPTLRLLAGAPHSSADEEASDLAPTAFRELGLDIAERLSTAAHLEGARQQARAYVAGMLSPMELTNVLSGSYIMAGHPAELQTWMGFVDYYDMILDGVIRGSIADVDAAVDRAARDLVSHRETKPVSLGTLLQAQVPAPPAGPRLRVRIAHAFRRRSRR